MTQATWTIENNEFVRVPGNRLSKEDMRAVSDKINQMFSRLPINLCNHCFQREVEFEGRKCVACARVIANGKAVSAERRVTFAYLGVMTLIVVVLLMFLAFIAPLVRY